MSKPNLAALGRDQLLKLAARCLEYDERMKRSLVEQHRPGDEQTIPTCLFCEFVVADGMEAVAVDNGAVICEACIESAYEAIEEKRRRAAACVSFPGCGCPNLDACRRDR